jgi:hypothetical protein
MAEELPKKSEDDETAKASGFNQSTTEQSNKQPVVYEKPKLRKLGQIDHIAAYIVD